MIKLVAALGIVALFCASPVWSQESDRRELEKLTIQGNKGLSRSVLKTLMHTRDRPWYARLPGRAPPLYEPRVLSRDVERIRRYYRDAGYYEVRIDTAVAPVHGRGVRVRIDIDEGKCTRVFRVYLDSLPDAVDSDSLDLTRRLQTRSGKPLLYSSLEYDRRQVLAWLQDRGYAFAQVVVQTEETPREHRRAARFGIVAGPRCRFGEVRVEGHRWVRETLVREGLTFRSGRLYQRRRLEESQRQLYRTGVFRSVTLGLPDSADQAGSVDVVVAVRERRLQRLKLGGGIATEEKARGLLEWQHRNFLGGARRLKGEVTASFLEVETRMSLRWPYVWSNKNWLDIDAFARREDQRVYEVARLGSEAVLSRDIGEKVHLAFAAGTELTDFAAARALTSFRLAIQTDNRDDIFDPGKGYMGTAVLEEAGWLLRSSRELVKLRAEGRWYHRVRLVRVLALRMVGGAIWKLGRGEEVTGFKRFYAGGASSVRGWGLNQLGPRDPSGALVGGQSLLEGSVELRPHLFWMLSSALFVDVGSVGRRYQAFRPETWRGAAGGGLRYQSPVGPVRLDLAYRLSEDRFDRGRWHYYFSLGQAF